MQTPRFDAAIAQRSLSRGGPSPSLVIRKAGAARHLSRPLPAEAEDPRNLLQRAGAKADNGERRVACPRLESQARAWSQGAALGSNLGARVLLHHVPLCVVREKHPFGSSDPHQSATWRQTRTEGRCLSTSFGNCGGLTPLGSAVNAARKRRSRASIRWVGHDSERNVPAVPVSLDAVPRPGAIMRPWNDLTRTPLLQLLHCIRPTTGPCVACEQRSRCFRRQSGAASQGTRREIGRRSHPLWIEACRDR
jgi:hypothetical protein